MHVINHKTGNTQPMVILPSNLADPKNQQFHKSFMQAQLLLPTLTSSLFFWNLLWLTAATAI